MCSLSLVFLGIWNWSSCGNSNCCSICSLALFCQGAGLWNLFDWLQRKFLSLPCPWVSLIWFFVVQILHACKPWLLKRWEQREGFDCQGSVLLSETKYFCSCNFAMWSSGTVVASHTADPFLHGLVSSEVSKRSFPPISVRDLVENNHGSFRIRDRNTEATLIYIIHFLIWITVIPF